MKNLTRCHVGVKISSKHIIHAGIFCVVGGDGSRSETRTQGALQGVRTGSPCAPRIGDPLPDGRHGGQGPEGGGPEVQWERRSRGGEEPVTVRSALAAVPASTQQHPEVWEAGCGGPSTGHARDWQLAGERRRARERDVSVPRTYRRSLSLWRLCAWAETEAQREHCP